MRGKIFLGIIIGLFFCSTSLVYAQGLPWRDHRAPFDFLFENSIDNHQQSKEGPDGVLLGYLYIEFTGKFEAGYPVAEHTDCSAEGANCSVGWQFRGVPGEATFVGHEPGNHPLWLVEPADIPQPGAFSHFHWKNETPNGPETAGQLELETSYDGYFLELTAKDAFVFQYGKPGDKKQVLIRPGIDTASHLNLVLSFPSEG